MNNPFGWVEIPVSDFDRAATFYGNIFGCTIEKQDFMGFLMGFFPWDEEGKGCTGAIVQGEYYTPSTDGVLVYFTTEDIEGTLENVVKFGGKVVMPKYSIGEHGFCGVFIDSEGNRVALHSRQ